MKTFKRILTVCILSLIAFISCTKDIPKELLNKQQQMPDDSIHRNISPQVQQEPHSEDETGDKKAEKLIKEADDADSRFLRSKSDADKKICIDKQLTAANYLMFEANLSPKKKYRPALKRYRRVLELDPGNKEALENKTQIEEIYRSMGMPVPD